MTTHIKQAGYYEDSSGLFASGPGDVRVLVSTSDEDEASWAERFRGYSLAFAPALLGIVVSAYAGEVDAFSAAHACADGDGANRIDFGLSPTDLILDDKGLAVISANAGTTQVPPRAEPGRLTTAMRHRRHLAYLTRVSTGGEALISPAVADSAALAWEIIRRRSGYQISVPSACTGPDGEMFYAWDSGRHHLELEMIPGQAAEFFYRDRVTEHFWGEDYAVGDPLPARVVEMLHLFR